MERLFCIKGCQYHKVTISGKIYSLKRRRFLKPGTGNRYLKIFIRINGIMYNKNIHRIVCETFHANPLNKSEVNHINCIKTDNRAVNLEWCDHKENMQHAVKNNLFINSGTKSPKRIPVIDTKTGIIYESIMQAAKELDKGDSHLAKCLSGKRKNKTTLKLYIP